MTAPRIETIEDLERIVAQQNATIEQLQGQVRLLVALVDAHHDLFITHGWAKPRPAEDPKIVH